MVEDAVTTGAAGERIVRIDSEAGRDPLVHEYAERHRASCALHLISWPWLLVGLVVSLLGGLLGDHLAGAPEALDSAVEDQWLVVLLHNLLGNPLAVCLGLLGGGLLAAILGRLIGHRGVSAAHEPLVVAPLLVAVYLLFYHPLVAMSVITGVVCAIYLAIIAYRILALALGGRGGLRSADLREPVGGWPIYTVLVPLYRETAIADKILKHLARLDYPRSRLDVKLLLEADDPDTLAAIEAHGIPDWCEVVIVPDAQPKTKPRACNHGLARARGEYLVIFDAEDQPDPDQLKQAALGFRSLDERTVCLQAQLAYRNHAQNHLTRWFTLEYNVWFRRYLRGLRRMRSPIPLGGTSNHFRTGELRKLGGWDPFNVTEDCDLGIRLHIAGQRTAMLDSVTWEEANSQVGNWIRQRSRWLKGYLATHLVWARRPLFLLRRAGPLGTVGFLAAVFGVAGLSVLNIPLWIMLGTFAVLLTIDLSSGQGWSLWQLLSERLDGTDRVSWPMVFTGATEDPLWSSISVVLFGASAVLLGANIFFVVVNLAFGRREGQGGLILAAITSPLYWVLISLAAWKGFWQLLVRPHYWEKTLHGLDHGLAEVEAESENRDAPSDGAQSEDPKG